MNEKNTIPVTFNTYKHHFLFLTEKIENWKNAEWDQTSNELLSIGENLADLYTGNLSVDNIFGESYAFFNNKNISNNNDFLKWLAPLEYRKIILSDSSEWIIKKGNDEKKYIHIHPGKKSPHTIRVRASTLKTVLTLMIITDNMPEQLNECLLTVNHIRTQYLRFSPVKSLHRGKGIYQLWELFFRHYRQHSR